MDDGFDNYLEAARQRGEVLLSNITIPKGFSQAALYAGLIENGLELAKLVQTEKRDLAAIETHYKLESARLEKAFKQVEAAIEKDYQFDMTLLQVTSGFIQSIIDKGSHDVALALYERMLSGFRGSPLEVILSRTSDTSSPLRFTPAKKYY
jgi:hypothetical protein